MFKHKILQMFPLSKCFLFTQLWTESWISTHMLQKNGWISYRAVSQKESKLDLTFHTNKIIIIFSSSNVQIICKICYLLQSSSQQLS